MIKVLNITEEGRGGGPLKRILLLADEMKGEIETMVVVPKSAELYISKLEERNIQYTSLSLHPLTKSPLGLCKYILFFIWEIYQLAGLYKSYQPDLVHVNGSWQVKGLIAAKLTKQKVVWHMNDTYQPFLIRYIFRLLHTLPAGFVYASERTKLYYEQNDTKGGAVQIKTIIPAPVDTDRISFIKREKKTPINVLTIGYINKHKGIELLIETAARMKGEDVIFDIVGPVLKSQRGYKQRLDQLIDTLGVDNVSFLGYRDINEKLLKGYDLYLCTSVREASPMAVWEAMASGMPVVSTPIGDVPSMMSQHNFGKLTSFDSGDVVAVLKEIINSGNEAYQDLAGTSRNVAVEYFSVEKVAKQYIRFYTDLLSESSD